MPVPPSETAQSGLELIRSGASAEGRGPRPRDGLSASAGALECAAGGVGGLSRGRAWSGVR
eukprot:1086204-Pyramimonas_sp.AAC.1